MQAAGGAVDQEPGSVRRPTPRRRASATWTRPVVSRVSSTPRPWRCRRRAARRRGPRAARPAPPCRACGRACGRGCTRVAVAQQRVHVRCLPLVALHWPPRWLGGAGSRRVTRAQASRAGDILPGLQGQRATQGSSHHLDQQCGSASRRAPRGPCTSARRAPRSTTASSRATTAAASCCASRTPTRRAPTRATRRAILERPALAGARAGTRGPTRRPLRPLPAERAARLYRAAAAELLAAGSAYHCFCPAGAPGGSCARERSPPGRMPRYDRRCRRSRRRGRAPAARRRAGGGALRGAAGEIVVDDLIRGPSSSAPT